MTSLQQKDTTFTKIFVGGLPYHTTDDTLQRFFEPYGQIDEAVVITDRQTGKSRGYGFVTMGDRAAAERACKDPNPIIDGRKANVNLAYLGAKPRLPVGELIAAFPYGLKTGLPSYFGSAEILGIPQLVYPTAYHLPTAAAATPSAATSFSLAAAAASSGAVQPPPPPPPHLVLPVTGPGPAQFVDYATLAAVAAAAASSSSYAAASGAMQPGTGGACIPLGAGDCLQTLAAFPFAVPAAAGVSGPTAAYASLSYSTAAGGPFPHQTVLGQLTAHPYHHHHHHHHQQIHAKLQ